MTSPTTAANQSKRPPLLAIVGPTGSGKSSLAVTLALQYNGEIVSADSRQIYKGMDIGTAKLKPPQGVKQWMTDVASPSKSYTVKQYQTKAMQIIHQIAGRGRLPILVGGTGLYVDSILKHWDIPTVQPNAVLRRTLEKDLQKDGLPALVRRLRLVDSVTARRIDTKNPRRVIRALEVALSSGKSFVKQQTVRPQMFNILTIGIAVSKEKLKVRVRKRTDAMISRGLVAETKRLLKRYSTSSPALSGIGYKETIEYLNGNVTRADLPELITQRTLQYVKRQMTWWKRDKSIVWVEAWEEASEVVGEWLQESLRRFKN